jgi:hypothetical protein
MKFNNNSTRIGGLILGFMLFLGITFVSSTTTQAQYWPYPNQDQIRRQRELERQRQREYQRQQQRQQTQQGWYDQWGNYHANNNGAYNDNGYYNRSRTTDGYGYYGGSAQSRQTALNAGYNEGMKAAREDRRSGRYNPAGHSSFRSADKDYNSRYGDRASYATYFRQAYQNGYADGWRGY